MSDTFYTSMAHDAAYSNIAGNIAQTGLLQSAGKMDTKALAAADKKLSLEHAKNNLDQLIADAMLKKDKKEKLSGFDTFA